MENKITKEILNYVSKVETEPLDAYTGPFTFEVINERLIQVKQFLKENEPDKRKYKRVYSVLVEMTENVIKHGRKDAKHNESAFLLYKNGSRYSLYVGNFVHPDDAFNLQKRVEFLKDKSLAELKEIKIEQLKTGQISDRGGAGLGLIEIAMKVDGKFSCEVKELEKDEYMMIMIINI